MSGGGGGEVPRKGICVVYDRVSNRPQNRYLFKGFCLATTIAILRFGSHLLLSAKEQKKTEMICGLIESDQQSV